MQQTQFDRNSMASWYARQHLKTDPGVESVYYLPKNAPEREIRFVEINNMIGERRDDSLEPLDFGVDTDRENEHRLFILDVTPAQWTRIQQRDLLLPGNWSLEDAVLFGSAS